mmetsp:Transcript_53684/g.85411  ORF Transcript_53684/g.85411 Transcript_53684/m.85411 type:complete len:210 (+) Transcript_53684:63-692(+)
MLGEQSHNSHNDIATGRFLQCWERCALSNATFSPVRSFALRDANVAVFAERCAPAILHLPILLAIVFTITNGKHSMVESGSTCIIGENTTCVVLENILVCFDGNRYRLLCDSCFQSILGLVNICMLHYIAHLKNQVWLFSCSARAIAETLIRWTFAVMNQAILVANRARDFAASAENASFPSFFLARRASHITTLSRVTVQAKIRLALQ